MFCSAMEKPKVAAEIPTSTLIGRMNRPRLWRSPMQSEMIRPLRTMSSSSARRDSGMENRAQGPILGRLAQRKFRFDPDLRNRALTPIFVAMVRPIPRFVGGERGVELGV